MDEIILEIPKMEEKIKYIQEYISLSPRRTEISEEISKLSTETDRVSGLLCEVLESTQRKLKDLLLRHKQTMMRMQKLEALTLDCVLKDVKHMTNKENIIVNQMSRMALTPASNAKIRNPMCQSIKKEGLLSVAKNIYKNTPTKSATKTPCRPNNMVFELQISSQLFESIPQYMRGRETLDELQNFVDNLIIPCFKEKYQLLNKPRSKVINFQDLELWRLYKEQSSYIADKSFITPGDIARKINRMIDKKLQNRLTMLRHIGLIQEQRVSQTVCYVWNS